MKNHMYLVDNCSLDDKYCTLENKINNNIFKIINLTHEEKFLTHTFH